MGIAASWAMPISFDGQRLASVAATLLSVLVPISNPPSQGRARGGIEIAWRSLLSASGQRGHEIGSIGLRCDMHGPSVNIAPRLARRLDDFAMEQNIPWRNLF
jgi:hypothetical protein